MLQLTVIQQALPRYHGNAIWCTDHVTKENLTCHNIIKTGFCFKGLISELTGELALVDWKDQKQGVACPKQNIFNFLTFKLHGHFVYNKNMATTSSQLLSSFPFS
jgi:hypothetical protein